MKTLKKVLAVILSLAIVVMGSATAFASSDDQTMVWNIYDEEIEAEYVGEITAENFAVNAQNEGSEYVYYTYDAEENGYYLITFEWYPVDDCAVAETIENGEVTECKEYEVFGSDDIVSKLYYIEEGKTYICFDRYSEGEDSIASIEFMGEELTDVVLEDGALEDLVIDVDILEYEYEEGFVWWSDAEYKFSSGKSFTQEHAELSFDMNDPLAEGEISLTLNVLNFSKDFTATAVTFDSIFASATIEDLEECTTVEEFYDGSIDTEKINGKMLEVTLADGSTVSGIIDYGFAYITLENGRNYYFDVFYSYEDDGNYYCNIVYYTYSDYVVFESFVCETVEADCAGNGEVLNNNITYPFEYALSNFFSNILNLDYATTIGEVIYVISVTFGEMSVDYEYAFANIFSQLSAYLMRLLLG